MFQLTGSCWCCWCWWCVSSYTAHYSGPLRDQNSQVHLRKSQQWIHLNKYSVQSLMHLIYTYIPMLCMNTMPWILIYLLLQITGRVSEAQQEFQQWVPQRQITPFPSSSVHQRSAWVQQWQQSTAYIATQMQKCSSILLPFGMLWNWQGFYLIPYSLVLRAWQLKNILFLFVIAGGNQNYSAYFLFIPILFLTVILWHTHCLCSSQEVHRED